MKPVKIINNVEDEAIKSVKKLAEDKMNNIKSDDIQPAIMFPEHFSLQQKSYILNILADFVPRFKVGNNIYLLDGKNAICGKVEKVEISVFDDWHRLKINNMLLRVEYMVFFDQLPVDSKLNYSHHWVADLYEFDLFEDNMVREIKICTYHTIEELKASLKDLKE
jgi:hypothetical protein